jgi:hypothetical protein
LSLPAQASTEGIGASIHNASDAASGKGEIQARCRRPTGAQCSAVQSLGREETPCGKALPYLWLDQHDYGWDLVLPNHVPERFLCRDTARLAPAQGPLRGQVPHGLVIGATNGVCVDVPLGSAPTRVKKKLTYSHRKTGMAGEPEMEDDLIGSRRMRV